MISLTDKFVSNCIVHDVRFDNVGIGRNGELKYFLGMQFSIDKSVDLGELGVRYRNCVEGMFGEGGRFRRAHQNKPSKLEF